MKRILTAAAIPASLLAGTVAKASGSSCLSQMVVNIHDTNVDFMKAKAKVLRQLNKKDIDAVAKATDINDRNAKLKTLLDGTSSVTGVVLGKNANDDVDGVTALVYRSTVSTMDYINTNLKNPNSPNAVPMRKGQVTMGIDQIILAHVTSND